MSGYTKGPWWSNEVEGDVFFVLAKDIDSVKFPWQIAEVTSWCGGDPSKGKSQSGANARLIAAAPELLEALEKFVEGYTEMVNSGDCGFWNPEDEDKVKAARAAIKKAKGE